MLTVYHGSTYRVEQPLAGVCRPNLDFGVGFYLTDLKDQAIRWALRTADIRHEKSVWLNIYSLDIDACRNSSFHYLHFLMVLMKYSPQHLNLNSFQHYYSYLLYYFYLW